MRAFYSIRKNEGEREIFKQLSEIQNIPLLDSKNLFFKFFNYKTPNEFLVALSQKIFRENIDAGLSSLVMIGRYGYNKPILIPYPKSWRKYFNSIGLKTHALSQFLFFLKLIIKYKEGIAELIHLSKFTFVYNLEEKKYISFVGVPDNAIIDAHKINLNNFLNFSQNKFQNVSLLFDSYHNEKINNNSYKCLYPFLPIRDSRKKILFIFDAFVKCLQSFIALLCGQWGYTYMLKDSILSSYIAFLDVNDLPVKTIFLNSLYIYKPLWAVELEKKSVEIALMFYATNTYNIQFENKVEYGLIPGYQKMTWNSYYTMHRNHKKFIEETINRKVKVIVEPKPFSLTDKPSKLRLPVGPKIALFDVQPFRDSFLATIGRPTNIYSAEVSEKIFSDIMKWCEANQVYLIVKPKREVNKRLCPIYNSLIENYSKNNLCFIVDPLYSPVEICKQVSAVICQPFTSAALFASAENKPVIYYDPISQFQSNQPCNQGIKLIKKCEEMYKFLNKSVLK